MGQHWAGVALLCCLPQEPQSWQGHKDRVMDEGWLLLSLTLGLFFPRFHPKQITGHGKLRMLPEVNKHMGAASQPASGAKAEGCSGGNLLMHLSLHSPGSLKKFHGVLMPKSPPGTLADFYLAVPIPFPCLIWGTGSGRNHPGTPMGR